MCTDAFVNLIKGVDGYKFGIEHHLSFTIYRTFSCVLSLQPQDTGYHLNHSENHSAMTTSNMKYPATGDPAMTAAPIDLLYKRARQSTGK